MGFDENGNGYPRVGYIAQETMLNKPATPSETSKRQNTRAGGCARVFWWVVLRFELKAPLWVFLFFFAF